MEYHLNQRTASNKPVIKILLYLTTQPQLITFGGG